MQTSNTPLSTDDPTGKSAQIEPANNSIGTNSPQVSTPGEPDSTPEGSWKYSGDQIAPQSDINPVSWSASEYIDHEKPALWFISVGGITFLISAVVYLVTGDLLNSIVIIMVSGLFIAAGVRKPRTLEYGLDNTGIRVGTRLYNYADFKSFAVLHEDAINSIQIFPIKRFAFPLSLYFPPDQEQSIVHTLGSYIPQEIRQHAAIDRFMSKVRF